MIIKDLKSINLPCEGKQSGVEVPSAHNWLHCRPHQGSHKLLSLPSIIQFVF